LTSAGAGRCDMRRTTLAQIIVSVVQSPFTHADRVCFRSLEHLVKDAIEVGVDGVLSPVAASEVAHLTSMEHTEGRVPYIVGPSPNQFDGCQEFIRPAEDVGATAYVVALPLSLYTRQSKVVPFERTNFSGTTAWCELWTN